MVKNKKKKLTNSAIKNVESVIDSPLPSGSDFIAGVGITLEKQTAPVVAPDSDAPQLFDQLPERGDESHPHPDSSCTLGDDDTASQADDSKVEGGDHSLANQNVNAAPWASLFKSNVADPVWLHQVPGNEELHKGVALLEDDVEQLGNTWGYSIIGYVAGRFPGRKAIMQCCQRWGVKFSYAPHESGWLVFKFQTENDMNSVLDAGPYFVFNRPLLLKAMPKLFDFGNEELFKVPIWLKLRNLPLELWNKKALSKILSVVGKPIRTDQHTAARSAISYARVLVEVDVSKRLLKEIPIILPGGKVLNQSVEYEKIPDFCHHCNMVGHKTSNCGHQPAENKAAGTAQQEKTQQEEVADPISELEPENPMNTSMAPCNEGSNENPAGFGPAMQEENPEANKEIDEAEARQMHSENQKRLEAGLKSLESDQGMKDRENTGDTNSNTLDGFSPVKTRSKKKKEVKKITAATDDKKGKTKLGNVQIPCDKNSTFAGEASPRQS